MCLQLSSKVKLRGGGTAVPAPDGVPLPPAGDFREHETDLLPRQLLDTGDPFAGHNSGRSWQPHSHFPALEIASGESGDIFSGQGGLLACLGCFPGTSFFVSSGEEIHYIMCSVYVGVQLIKQIEENIKMIAC